MQQGNKAGFSLVELSIVLVILGLLVGGILGGQSLIRAAELRRVSQDIEKYSTAINAFRIKYFYYPGDLPNATRFWGAHSAHCAGEPGAVSADGVCNGNGNGQINLSGDLHEHTYFWNHLAKSGLVAGTYDMDWRDGVEIGVHVPTTAFSGASFRPAYMSKAGPTNTWWFEGLEGHIFRFGVPNNGVCNSCFNAIPGFLPEEAWSIDMKIDDGKPGQGKVQVAHGEYGTTGLGCADTNDSAEAATAEYNINAGRTSCLQVYVMD